MIDLQPRILLPHPYHVEPLVLVNPKQGWICVDGLQTLGLGSQNPHMLPEKNPTNPFKKNFNAHGDVITYIDEEGSQWVAPYSKEKDQQLAALGYKKQPLWVPCSNGEHFVDPIVEDEWQNLNLEEMQKRYFETERGWIKAASVDKPLLRNSRYGSMEFRQSANGQIAVLYTQLRATESFKNGLLNVPSRQGRINILYSDKPGYALASLGASGYELTQRLIDLLSTLQGKEALHSLSPDELLKIVVQHEQRHAQWYGLNDNQRKEILSFFPSNDPRLLQFAHVLVRRGNYLKSSKIDLQINPNQDVIYLGDAQEKDKLPKNRIVNELLAMGSWTEVIQSERLSLLDQIEPIDDFINRRYCMMEAAKYISSLPTSQRNRLRELGLSHYPSPSELDSLINTMKKAIQIFKVEASRLSSP